VSLASRACRLSGRLFAAAMLALGSGAVVAQPAAGTASQWNGTYSCSTKPGLFSKPSEVFRSDVRLTLKDGALTGLRDTGDYRERFHGSVNPLGEVTLVADGFWTGAVTRTTSLQATGSAGGFDMFLNGERAEQDAGRNQRPLDCVLMLARAFEASELAVELEPPAIAAPAAPPVPAAGNAQRAAPPAPPASQPQAVAVAVAVATPPPASAQPQAAPPPVAAARPQAAAPPPVARRALVIGNNAYHHVPRLNNAAADAVAMAESLARAGFEVTRRMDLDERGFKQVLRDFRAEILPGDEVVLFYAGHGVQLGGANFLLPVDIRGDNEEQVRDESMPLQRMLDDFADRRAGFMLAIIDACRDNPFRTFTRAIAGRGLAPTTAASGQMIIYSAGFGQQALDRLGPDDTHPNGLFTRVFLREMEAPDVTVDRVLRNVRNEVVRLARSVGHLQTPALYDQAVGDFYLRRGR
jgi:hypothetical protein